MTPAVHEDCGTKSRWREMSGIQRGRKTGKMQNLLGVDLIDQSVVDNRKEVAIHNGDGRDSRKESGNDKSSAEHVAAITMDKAVSRGQKKHAKQ